MSTEEIPILIPKKSSMKRLCTHCMAVDRVSRLMVLIVQVFSAVDI